MYESFYQFREKPFSLLPDPKFLYIGESHRKFLAKMRASITHHNGMLLITGEIGCGKTTLIQYLKGHIDKDVTVGYISNTQKAFGALLPWIINAFNVKLGETASKIKLHQAFISFVEREHAKKRRCLLIVDEAQNLGVQLLEELRLLSNVNINKQVLQIILVGQPELRDILRWPDMRQFLQRVAVDYHFEPLDKENTQHYIRHRVKVAGGDPALFEPAACDLIFRYSNGVPRLINSICDNVLMVSFEQGKKTINTKPVNEIVSNWARYDLFDINRALAKINTNTPEKTRHTTSGLDQQEAEAKLVLTREGQLLGEYLIKGERFTIGRREDNDIHLTSRKVSRVHARILSNARGNLLEDLNSHNGTFINAKRVSKYTLRNGDVIKIGKYRLSYKTSTDFSHSLSENANTKPSRLELEDVIINKKKAPIDITTLDFETTSVEAPQTKTQHSNYTTKSEKIIDSPPEKSSQKRDLDQALKTLEDLLD